MPTVVYGATGFVACTQQSERWCPGVFADPDVFTYGNWARHYGSLLLNSPNGVQVTTVGDFAGSAGDDDRLVFVHPVLDIKSIVGEVMEAGSRT